MSLVRGFLLLILDIGSMAWFMVAWLELLLTYYDQLSTFMRDFNSRQPSIKCSVGSQNELSQCLLSFPQSVSRSDLFTLNSRDIDYMYIEFNQGFFQCPWTHWTWGFNNSEHWKNIDIESLKMSHIDQIQTKCLTIFVCDLLENVIKLSFIRQEFIELSL